jgi:exodeoxyribonuclease V gamma subunit
MVTDANRQEYLTHIESIFRERFGIPYNMIDRSLSAQSRMLEAALRLLDLPLGELTYLEVMGVACHPLIGGGAGVDLDDWRRWGDALNVRFGADERALEGTYIDRDVYHWDQGLKRLLLGLFMEGERSGDERIFEVGERAWVPVDVGGDHITSAGRMIHLIRCLLLDATQMSEARLSLARWCQLFTRVFMRYLKPVSPADEQVISRCIETIEELKRVDLEGTSIRYEVAQSMLRARMKQLDSTRGQHQADGVVVSSLLPMRAIPFHTIFVLGLGEQEFPAKTPQDPIDLRQAQQLAGDVSPSQRDRYLFLETLLSARERIIMSYVALDDRTGDSLEPSAVVRELHFILRGYVGPSGLQSEIHPLSAYAPIYDSLSLPLRRLDLDQRERDDLRDDQIDAQSDLGHAFDETHDSISPKQSVKESSEERSEGPGRYEAERPGWAPSVVASSDILRGIRAYRLREHLNQFIGGHTIPREELESAIKIWSQPELNRYLDLSAPPSLERDQSAITRLTLHDLYAFLRSPLQGSARAMLRLRYDEVIDQEATLNDPLHYSYLKRFNLLQTAFWRGGGDRERTASVYEDEFDRATLRGETPVGFFAQAQRAQDGQVLHTWLLNAHQFQLRDLSSWLAVSIGEGREFEDVGRRLPPLRLSVPLAQGGDAQVELVGRMSPLRPDLGATLHCLPSGGVGEHLFITGFLEMVMLAAAQQPLPRVFEVYLNPYSDFRSAQLYRRYYTPNPAQARDYLKTLITELTQGFHAYRLPIRAVLRWRDALARDAAAPLSIRPDDPERGPIKELRAFPPPPPAVAVEMVQRRLGPWFNSEVPL